MKFKCLIVEDELPAQRVIQTYIRDVPALELVQSCNNALDALEVLKTQAIDILFLDIQLPKITGVNFLRSLTDPPQTIFTTAYSEYAIQGFELDAVDYLLKPFSFDRFLKAVNKAVDRLEARPRLATRAGEEEVNDSDKDFVFFKADKKIIRINLDDLLYIEGLKDYVRVVTTTETSLVLQTMKHWESILPSSTFQRAHKSYIVNLKRIDHIKGNEIKIGAREVPIGRHYKDSLLKEIEKRFIN